ncbi:MAG: proprotein convertase P-domain-containing protein, partial [Planctomycetes bacterium]|nr:proprotein convertase P-domain-containing protein [Planctomycetota bacterium]
GSLPTGDEWTEVVSTSFPDAEAASFSNYSMAGYQIGSLRVFPVEYDAATDTLTYHSEVSINVTVSAVATDGTVDVRDVEGDRDRVARLVDNPDALDFYTVTTTGDPSDPAAPGDAEPAITALPGGNYEYVVITSAALADTFQDLVDQKTSRGLSAGIVTTEYVSANYTGTENGDLADKIRHFISDAYANWGTEWVLLGGDTEIIPVRGVYAAVGSTVDNALPTDMYYACLDGTWNGDGDGLWGEANDGTGGGDIDLAPEVYIGRAPVSNATEAFNFVAKTVRYETTTHANVDTAVWLGESLDASTFGSYSGIPIRDQSLPDDWNVVEMYDSAGGWTAGDLLNQLNASPNIVNHLGHANETYNARLYNSNVAALSNEDPFFMYSQGCMSGSLDTHNISIAEQYVVDDHGAFGVVMNSRYGWYMPGTTPSASHYYANEFWDAVFNEGLTSLGQANQDSKDDNMFRVGTTGSYRWITFETNLFGDPETAIQTATGPVAPPTGVEGTVWNDTNGNGVMDGEEQGLAGQRVYLDANGNGQYDNDSQTVVSGQVPVTIIDNEAVTSALVIDGGPQSIYDLNVTLNITHTYDSDLEIYLISPNATRVMLVNRAGGGGDNFTNTTLDDEADTHISTATAPFTGTYRAAELLSAFDGEDANGTWTLEIWDRATYDSGELTGWSMELCGSMPETSVATDAQGEFSFSDLAAGSYSIGHELSGGWSHTQPGSGILNVDVGEGVVVGNVDFGVREETLPPAVDLGTIDFLEIAGLDPTGGDLWYTLETSHQGYLTLEALFAGSGDQLEMALHDVNFNVLANSTVSTGGERIDWQATVGQTFYLSVQGTVAEVDLRLANLVSRNGTELTIHGTDGDDEFRLAAGTTHQVTINGVDYAFSGTEVTAVAFAGGAGSDAAVLVASAGADTARAWPTSATLTGGSYSVSVTQVSDISLVGNGDNDVAFLYDSAGDDTLVVNDAYARMSGGLPGEAFSAQADNFRYVHGYSRAGGTDTAELYGTVGNDTVVTRQTDAKIMGAEHFGRAWYFDAVTVQGGGGNDLAVLFDSAGQDILRASPTNTTFSGNLFDYQILGVRSVRAYSSGGNDVAFLYDSAGDDTLVVDDTHGSLTGGLPGETFALAANDFRYIHGYSTAGGTDTAELYGTAGKETVVTRPTDAKIAGTEHFGRAWYFDAVTVHGGGGDDSAVLKDSA